MNRVAGLAQVEFNMPLEIYLPDPIIETLESQVIIPNKVLSPTLGVIIKTTDTADAYSYLKSIQQKAKKYNAHLDIKEVASAAGAGSAIQKLREIPGIYGIINLSRFGGADRALSDMIPARLDLDCTSSNTLGALVANPSNIGFRLAPCAAVACYKVLEYEYGEDLSGLNIAILGRSLRVGRPLAEILCQKNATVTVMHSKSEIHSQELWNYDIVISAMGVPNELDVSDLIYDKDYDSGIEERFPQTIIDVGMGIDKTGNICGDIDRTGLAPYTGTMKITPTIGGIGKLATTILFSKLFANAANSRGIVL